MYDTIAIVQARLASTRLPGKVLKDVAGHSLLDRVLAIASAAETIQHVVLATSVSGVDDDLASIDLPMKCTLVRGSEADVLNRFVLALRHRSARTVVRLTADNPLVDPSIIDRAVTHHLSGGFDYTFTEGLPLGMNVEIINASALHSASENGRGSADREHVTHYVRQRPRQYKQGKLEVAVTGLDTMLRLTVDTTKDLELVRLLYVLAGNTRPSPHQLADYAAQYPNLLQLNRAVEQKKTYDSVAEELAVGVALLKRQDLHRAAEALTSLDWPTSSRASRSV